MADIVQINQAGVVTVYDPAAKNQVNQVGLVVVYSDQAAEGKTQVDAAGVVVVYSDLLPAKRNFPVHNPKTRWQSQPGKRVFPVVG